MLDFVMIDDKGFQKDTRIIKPKFDLSKIPPNDLMIRGGDIYAVWDENTKLWVTEADAFKYIVKSIDKDLKECADKWREQGGVVKVKWMWDSDSGSMDRFLKYVKRQMPTNCYKPLDSKLIFSNMETKREDYASKKLPYPLIKGEYPNYEELISTLYNPENRRKLEWAIGSIIHGDSRSLQKFVVIYGEAGSGKSTILNIIQELCKGYWTTFDAKGLGQAGNQFPLESFKDDPIVAIQHDGDLSKIEDNTRLNSLVSHESVEMNIKNLKKFPMTIHSFMFIGTNSPVKFTDGKSGLQRRLIDVHPSGKRIPTKKYGEIMAQIPFELGAIAYHCLEVYKKLGKHFQKGFMVNEMMVPLDIGEELTKAEMCADTRFRDVRPMKVQQARVLRTRPRFNMWNITFTAAYDEKILSFTDVVDSIEYAGQYVGLCDSRPKYGKFAAKVEELD